MILTASGLRFANEGDHWRCVESPDLVMLPGERYRVGERVFATSGDALRHLKGAAELPSRHARRRRRQWLGFR